MGYGPGGGWEARGGDGLLAGGSSGCEKSSWLLVAIASYNDSLYINKLILTNIYY